MPVKLLLGRAMPADKAELHRVMAGDENSWDRRRCCLGR